MLESREGEIKVKSPIFVKGLILMKAIPVYYLKEYKQDTAPRQQNYLTISTY